VQSAIELGSDCGNRRALESPTGDNKSAYLDFMAHALCVRLKKLHVHAALCYLSTIICLN